MSEGITFNGCYSGTDFENYIVRLLEQYGITACRTGKDDGGIDIVATHKVEDKEYTFNIQCKFQNSTLGKHPIQEVYAGTNYYGNGGTPVVITNNHVTADARVYAKRLGVEIIADAEWLELKQTYKAKRIINPNGHKGLCGILIAHMICDGNYMKKAVEKSQQPPSNKEQLKLELLSNFDEAEECIREAAHFQQKAAQFQQKALTLQKEALLKNLEYD
jgi:hypothetical protein